MKYPLSNTSSYTKLTQQKQIGCFNHTVVSLVADKQMRQWLCTVYFANCIRQPERGSFSDLLQPQSCRYSNYWSCIFERGHTSMYVKEHTIITIILQIIIATFVRESPQKHHALCSDSLTDVLRVVSYKVCFGLRLLMQLTSNTKINHCLLQPG